MKKVLSLFLLLLMTSPAIAEKIDIFSLNYEEKLQIYEELSEFFNDTFTLKPGIYEVGKDVKAGTYRFMYEIDGGWMTSIRIGSEVNVSKTDLIYARQSFDLWDPYGNSYWFQLTEAYYRVKDGDFIVIENGDVRMELLEKDLRW